MARFVTLAILSGIFIAVGIVPGQVVADIITSWPDWLSHPLTRITALVLGGLLGVWTYKLYKSWRGDPRGASIPDSSEAASVDHWATRVRLEISVLANVSAGRKPNDSPIKDEPENTRLRDLKDGIDMGNLETELNGDRPNVGSTVTLEAFEKFVAEGNKQHWVDMVRRWQAGHAPSGAELTEEIREKRIPLLRFIEIAGRHGWPILDPGGYGGFDLIHGISESAGLGDLVVLGKEIDSQLPGMVDANRRETIPAEVWKRHEIDAMSCFIFTNPGIVIGLASSNKETQTKGDRGDLTEPPNYKDLYLETEGLMDWLKNDADQHRGFFQETYGD